MKWRPLLREPLLQLAVVGVALFALDAGLRPPSDAGRRIVVSASQQAALRELLRVELGREPQTAEVRARLDHWIEEQVLYREALALGLDRKDAIVRRQLSQKMRLLLEDGVRVDEPTVAQQQAWLDQHPERYGRAASLSFEQVFLDRTRHGADPAQAAQRVAQALKTNPDGFASLGDPFPTGATVTRADAVRLRKQFGEGFAERLDAQPDGVWSGPLRSAFGLHFVRITQRTPLQRAALAEVAERVRSDWRNAGRERLAGEALAQLRARYSIEFAP